MNIENLREGNEVYKKILDIQPTIALVNEQAYSSGLIQLYLDAGYKAIVMEWDNPAHFNPEWNPDWRYYPQYACSQNGKRIALIWNNSIAFQKFQRYSHNEIELDEYLEYLVTHLSAPKRLLPLYGNDVEIFDFRPGRFHTEANLGKKSEWLRIEKLFSTISDDNRFELISPSKVLTMLKLPDAGNDLCLESPECPIPVKKQGKYNITRWAVTGRDDLSINSACWRIYETLKGNADTSKKDWKELCYLWSSDFRTHITIKRWEDYCERLMDFEKQVVSRKIKVVLNDYGRINRVSVLIRKDVKLEKQGRYLTVETDSVRICFNCQRGLAIDRLWFKDISNDPLIGTLKHGYYDDISLGVDLYSGHFIFETPGKPKVTDLNPVTPLISGQNDGPFVIVSAKIPTIMGTVHKSYYISKETSIVKLCYTFDWQEIPVGSLRLGHLTLIPSSFDHNSLFFRSHNGGTQSETFMLKNYNFDHGSAVSFLVSAGCAVGMTEKKIELGDSQYFIGLTVDKGMGAFIGMLTYRITKDTYFYRLALSVSEMDDTSRHKSSFGVIKPFDFSLTLFSKTFN